MAVILAFALTARLRAGIPDPRAFGANSLAAGKTLAPRDLGVGPLGPFRWAIDAESGKLSCHFEGEGAEPDPLSYLLKSA